MKLVVAVLFAWVGVARAGGVPEGTHAIAGSTDGLEVEVRVEGPATQSTPLQVACVFEYTEGDLTRPPALPAALNGMRHLDDALGGVITTLRRSGQLAGHALETLLLEPPPTATKAPRILLVGLGPRTAFSPEVMERVGAVGMREALRLGVTSYSHASDLKDAGIDSDTAEIARRVIHGARAALRTQQLLANGHLVARPAVRKLTLLAGPAFYETTLDAARAALAP